MNNGYIKLHRKITDWEWYQDANTFRVFIHLLLECNHEDRKWRGITIQRGECFTSIRRLSEALKLSVREVRTALEHLKTTQEIAVETTSERAKRFSRQGTFITIENYENYQMRADSLETRLTKAMTQRATLKATKERHKSDTRATQ